MRTLLVVILALPCAAFAHTDCSELRSLKLPSARIVAAEQRPGFCEVSGIATPVPTSRIGFTVWLPPADRWSQRLHMVGNGGYSSRLYVAQLEARVARGDAAVATDTGHTGGELTFGRDNPEAIVDWGNRAVHESVVAAKAVVRAFYGRPQRYAYFSGSSTGGHQGLMAAQRHPEDFDGIIAGAPGNNRTNLNLAFLWSFLHNHRRGDNAHAIVPNLKLAMVHAAVVKTCDGLDGVTDGVISDPRDCVFDLPTLRCTGAETDGCLTDEQIATLRAIYRGPRDARNGKQIFPGFPFGSEGIAYGDAGLPGWSNFWADPDEPSRPQRADFFRHWVFHDAQWDWWKFDWGNDVDKVTRTMAPVLNATDPDLSRFRSRGGKLILFVGWNDPVGSAFDTIDYYESVVARGAGSDPASRLEDTQKFARLYVVPGMSHTAGGPGATHFSNATRDSAPPVEDSRHDMGLALYDWVERGIAPEELIGTHFSAGSGPSGTVAFQRPLCVYPQTIRYRGGDTRSADSFHCAAPVELLASGYGFTEGPVWMPQLHALLFSDLPGNVVHKYDPRSGRASVHLLNAGFTGPDPWRWGGMSNNGRDRADPRFEEFAMLGPDGLAVDARGRLILTTFAGRSLVRIEKSGKRTVLAERYQGQRFNGTNDVVVKRDGSIYFTDTFGGLRRRGDDPRKEIPINAVYRWKDGAVDQVVSDMTNTNGLAFSPDETVLYVNASRDNYIHVYDVRQDGTLANGRLFADLRGHAEKGVTDGMKVDTKGNVSVTGPGGIWVIAPSGQHIGTIRVPEVPINLAFGDDDRRSLYITAHSGLYRTRVKIPGL